MKIKLYGPGRGNGSWARVTAGMCEGLTEIESLAAWCQTDELSHDLEHALGEGFDAPVAIHVGPPASAGAMLRGAHQHRLAMVAANSSWLPEGILYELATTNTVTGFLAPSAWAAAVIDSYELGVPTYVFEHGVSWAFDMAETLPLSSRGRGAFKALHLASTANERKGTQHLVEVWAELVADGKLEKAELEIFVDGPVDKIMQNVTNGKGIYLGKVLRPKIAVETRVDANPADMAFWMSSYDVIVQPSRAEGFGLVPLEARATGVPVILSNGTGHDQHLAAPWDMRRHGAYDDRGVLVVANRGEHPIDDGPGALAPEIERAHLRSAILRAYERREEILTGAVAASATVREYWSWSAACRRFIAVYGEELCP